MKIVSTQKAPAAIGPYSQAVIINGILYSSGQIPIDPQIGVLVEGDITKQTEQVVRNIVALLNEAGSNLSRVIKTTCFLKDMNDFAAFNEIYGKHFTSQPARSCVEVSALPKNALVEIEVIAEV